MRRPTRFKAAGIEGKLGSHFLSGPGIPPHPTRSLLLDCLLAPASTGVCTALLDAVVTGGFLQTEHYLYFFNLAVRVAQYREETRRPEGVDSVERFARYVGQASSHSASYLCLRRASTPCRQHRGARAERLTKTNMEGGEGARHLCGAVFFAIAPR